MLYVMVGYPGSGKTTHARTIVAARVCIDDLWMMMFGEYSEEFYATLCEYEDLIVHDLLAQDFDVVIDRCNISAAERRHWVRIAQRQGKQCTAVFMATLWDTCVERVTERERRAPIERSVMENYRQRFQFPNEQEGFVEVITVGGRDVS